MPGTDNIKLEEDDSIVTVTPEAQEVIKAKIKENNFPENILFHDLKCPCCDDLPPKITAIDDPRQDCKVVFFDGFDLYVHPGSIERRGKIKILINEAGHIDFEFQNPM